MSLSLGSSSANSTTALFEWVCRTGFTNHGAPLTSPQMTWEREKGRKEERKKGRKEERKEGRKEERKKQDYHRGILHCVCQS